MKCLPFPEDDSLQFLLPTECVSLGLRDHAQYRGR